MPAEKPSSSKEISIYGYTALSIIRDAQLDLPPVLFPRTPRDRAQLAALMSTPAHVVSPEYSPRLSLGVLSDPDNLSEITLFDYFQERDGNNNDLKLDHKRQVFFGQDLTRALLSGVGPGETVTVEGTGTAIVRAATDSHDSRINADRLLNFENSAETPLQLGLELSPDLRRVVFSFRVGEDVGALTFEKGGFLRRPKHSASFHQAESSPVV
jgi:hypothetical protein